MGIYDKYRAQGYSDDQIFRALSEEDPSVQKFLADGYTPSQIVRAHEEENAPPPPHVDQNSGWAGDTWTDLKRGALNIPGAAAALVELPYTLATGDRPLTRAGDWVGEKTGLHPGKKAEGLRREYSTERQASDTEANAQWQERDWADQTLEQWGNNAYSLATHPRSTSGHVAESVPSIATGGLLGAAAKRIGEKAAVGLAEGTPGYLERVVGEKWVNPSAAGIGEGGVAAGDQLAEYDPDRPNQQRAAWAALGTGATTAIVGAGGARISGALGHNDIDVLMMGGGRAALREESGLGLKAKVGRGLSSMGLGATEEVLQTGPEKVLSNYANDYSLGAGTGQAMAEAGMAGGVMGAGGALAGHRESEDAVAQRQESMRQEAVAQEEAARQQEEVAQAAAQEAAQRATLREHIRVQNPFDDEFRTQFAEREKTRFSYEKEQYAEAEKAAADAYSEYTKLGSGNEALGLKDYMKNVKAHLPKPTPVRDAGIAYNEHIDQLTDATIASTPVGATRSMFGGEVRPPVSEGQSQTDNTPGLAPPGTPLATPQTELFSPNQPAAPAAPKPIEATLETPAEAGARVNAPVPLGGLGFAGLTLASRKGIETLVAERDFPAAIEAMRQHLDTSKTAEGRDRLSKVQKRNVEKLIEVLTKADESNKLIVERDRQVTVAETQHKAQTADQEKARKNAELRARQDEGLAALGALRGTSHEVDAAYAKLTADKKAGEEAALREKQDQEDALQRSMMLPETQALIFGGVGPARDMSVAESTPSILKVTSKQGKIFTAKDNITKAAAQPVVKPALKSKVEEKVAPAPVKKETVSARLQRKEAERVAKEKAVKKAAKEAQAEKKTAEKKEPKKAPVPEGRTVAGEEETNEVKQRAREEREAKKERAARAAKNGRPVVEVPEEDTGKAVGVDARNNEVRVDEINTNTGDEDTQYAEPTSVENPHTKKSLDNFLAGLFRSSERLNRVVVVYATQAEAVTANPGIKLSQAKGRIGGFTSADGKVGLIAEHISQGRTALGITLHEIGVHLGMEKLVGKANMKWLQDRVIAWSKLNDGSKENLAAIAAVRQAEASSSTNKGEELIAYMTDELVTNYNVDPQAFGASNIHQWFRRMFAGMKIALRKLGFKRTDFSGQDLVNLAYGAAELEMSDSAGWHGTAAEFRKFNHAYMGAGEGAQAYGWGTYLAQRVGIAKDYWKQDVARKSPNLNLTREYYEGIVSEKKKSLARLASNMRNYESRKSSVDGVEQNRKLDSEFSGFGGYLSRMREMASEDTADIQRAEEDMDNTDFTVKAPKGSLMHVAANVQPDEMLDWDKPLSEQSEKVREGWDKAYEDHLSAKFNKGEGMKGEALYKHLQAVLGSGEAASKYLDSIGIKGIKFLDQPSRGGMQALLSKRLADLEAERKKYLARYTEEVAEARREHEERTERARKRNAGIPAGSRITAREVPVFSEPSTYNSIRVSGINDQMADTQRQISEISEKTSNLVIFNDKNLVRVKTHPGADRESIQFSQLPMTVSPTSPSRGVWEKAGAAFDSFFRDPMAALGSHNLGWLSLDHLVEVARGTNDKLAEYRAVSRAMQSMSKEWVVKAAKIDAEWGKLDGKPGSMADKLHDVMRLSTRAKFDPTLNVAPVNAEETRVASMFSKLSPEAVKVFKAARDHYAAVRVERQDIASSILTSAHRLIIASAKKSGDAKRIAKAEGDLARQLSNLDKKYRETKGPYFPLMRIGGWYATGMSKTLADLERIEDPSAAEEKKISELRKDEAHYTVSAYSSKSKAEAAVKELSAKYAVTRFNMAEEKNYSSRVLAAAGMQDVEKYLDAFDKGVADEIRTMMAELYYEALPEHHTLKQEMKREGVHGEEKDMRRVFARSALSSAHYLSRLKYTDQLKSAMFAIAEEGKKGPDARKYYNEIVMRSRQDMEETNAPWADKLAAVSYLAHLGVNPAFILTNATQVAMITTPWLAARTSTAKATAALMKAYGTSVSLIWSSYDEQGWRAELNWEGKVPAGVASMLNTLLKRNLLDITIEHDLGAIAELKSHALGDKLKMANLPVHITELANRSVTAIAAYNLAINELKMNQAQAEEFASTAVSATQLDYSALNAPRHMRRVLGSAPAAKIVMQFRKYQQGMLWLIGRSIYVGLKGATPKERSEARKTLFGLFTTTGIMAGTLGMPMVGSALWIASALASFGGPDDEPEDYRVSYQNWLAELVGVKAATAITKGLPAALWGMDLEKRLGQGDIASPLPFMRHGKSTEEKTGYGLLAAAGAPVGTLVDMVNGVQLMGQGEWHKGLEKFVPAKGIQNLIRAHRFELDGMTDKRGNTILPPDEFDMADIGLKVAGFATTKESQYYEGTQAIQEAKAAATDVRSRLLDKFAQARLTGEDTGDIMDAINDFNDRHPEKGVRIDASSRMKSVQAHKMAARQRSESGISMSKQNRAFASRADFAQEE